MNFKKITILSIVAVTGLATFAACGHRHHFSKDRSERMIKKLDYVADRLDLAGEQQAKYQDLRARVLVDLKAGHQARLETMRQLKAEFEKPEPNMNALAADVKKRMETGHQRFQKAPDYVAEFYGFLNAEQKAEVKEFVLDKLEDL
ncbi:MAG: Spy/CpxP family protein refolding chaperone [Leptospirales bacterium]|jgi:Spy/CpxP family protein refolding chaperone